MSILFFNINKYLQLIVLSLKVLSVIVFLEKFIPYKLQINIHGKK